MKKKLIRGLLCVLAVSAVLTAAAAMASGGAGSQSDPLVTLSYLTDTFTAQIMDKVDDQISQRNIQLERGAGAYAAVTLEPGQTLHGEAGCELLLRSGEASCTASPPPGLVDATSGGRINGGERLQVNHLYFMTDSRAVTAAGGAAMLVRGRYEIE